MRRVVLLHALGRRRQSMARMERALRERGFCVDNIGYPSLRLSVAELGEHVWGQVDAEQPGPVDFVTHSLGGVVLRQMLATHALSNLGRVIMLGPPNGGSEVADFMRRWPWLRALIGPAALDLGTDPDSVPNRLGPADFDLGVISGNRSVNWLSSRLISGPNDGKVSIARTQLDGMRAHRVVPVAHPFLPTDARVIRIVCQWIEEGF